MQKRSLLASALLLASVAACKQPEHDPTTQAKLDELSKKLDNIQRKVDQLSSGAGGAPNRPQRPPPPERPTADPNAVYSVAIGDAPVRGPANARVTIVEAADFACPFCRQAEPTMDQIAQAYPNDVRLVFKHYVVHPQVATTPALATCAAQQQNKFWEMKKAVWESAWPNGGNPVYANLGEDNMIKLAQTLQLDVEKFKTDMKSKSCNDQISGGMQSLSQVGVDGTPAFYVNGRIISGALPFEQFKQIIDQELKKADDVIKGGDVTPENFYQKMVIEKGKKSLS